MDTVLLREAVFAGQTANAFKMGSVLSLGWFWMRTEGASILYRGERMDAVDFGDVLAVESLDAKQMSPPVFVSHAENETYFYVVRRVNGCGRQEQTFSGAVRIDIDQGGDLAEPRPKRIFAVKVRLVNGDEVELVWYYCPLAQPVEPISFAVFSDGGIGQIDFENAVATVDYAGRRFYSYQSGALDAGRYLFCIKAEDANGQMGPGMVIQVEVSDSTPGTIEIVGAESV